MFLIDAIPYIKQTITARQTAEALGLQIDQHGRCRCVWHEDQHPSLKLYDGERGCYCFACHNGGDVVALVRQARNCSLREALQWFDVTFSLGLGIKGPSAREKLLQARAAENERRMQREEAEEFSRRADNAALDALDAVMMIEDAITQEIADAPLFADTRLPDVYLDRLLEMLRLRDRALNAAEDTAVIQSIAEEKRRNA